MIQMRCVSNERVVDSENWEDFGCMTEVDSVSGKSAVKVFWMVVKTVETMSRVAKLTTVIRPGYSNRLPLLLANIVVAE